jgi:hypothetical protein
MRLVQRLFSVVVIVTLLSGSANSALIDITRPGDPIELVNGTNAPPDTNAGPPPGAEGVENAINDIGQKYLNFLDLGSGFRVTPSANPGNSPVVGIRFYTANDAVDRDPSSFVLSGSNDSINGPWTNIAASVLALPDGRNPGGNAVSIPPSGNLSAFNQTVLFANSQSYDHYRVIFPTIKNEIAANSMQIAEVELLVPEPAGIALAFLGLAGLLPFALRRRR